MSREQQAPAGVEITPEVARLVVGYLAALQRLRDSITPRTFDTAWLVPIITLAAWVLIAWMYLSH